MDPNKKKERQTGIIDDATAMAAEVQALNGRKGGGKKRLNLSKAQSAAISKPKLKAAPQITGAVKASLGPKNGRQSKSQAVVTSPTADEAQFYEVDGLRIPLFDNKSKRKTHARSINTLTQHLNRDKMLGIVRNYAGEAEVQEFEAVKASKTKIAEWIAAVETKAFGSGPKGKATASEKAKNTADVAPTKAQQKAQALAHNTNTESNCDILSEGANAQGKRKRDNHVTATQDQQTTKKAKVEPSMLAARSRKELIPREYTRLPPHPQPQMHPQAAEEDMAPRRKRPQQHQKPSVGPPPKKLAVAPPPRAPDVPHHHQSGSQAGEDSMKNLAANVKDIDLYIPKMNIVHRGEEHPLIDALELDPHWYPVDPDNPLPVSSTRILNLPAKRAHAIITAGSETTVHVTEIPYKDTKKHRISAPEPYKAQEQGKQPQEAAPYLKPGPHGYDIANHHWHFATDPDVLNGVGHQVESADAAAWESMLFRTGEQSKLVASISKEIKGLNAQIAMRSEEPEDSLLRNLKMQKQQKDAHLEMEKAKLKELKIENFWFRKEFREKYSGTLAGQWPCGCEKVGARAGAWEMGDSEAE